MASSQAGGRARAACALALLLALGTPLAQAEPADVVALRLEGSRIVAVLRDGSILDDEALSGLELRLEGQPTHLIRIDGVAPDAHALGSPLPFYDVSLGVPGSGRWEKLCQPDPHGRTSAIAVPGYWTEDGRFVRAPPGAFSFACTAGAQAKCVQFGYPPWATGPDGASLAPYHAACVRMVRADYCGDGTPHTVPGVAIQMFDRAGVHARPSSPYGTFEALWGPEGAVCLARARRPEFPLASILRRCPRLAEVPPAACTASAIDSVPGALLGNRS